MRDGLSLSGALQPAIPGFAETTTLLNVRLLGPADSAAYLVPVIDGLPQPPITVLAEVKNIRSWVYPNSAETLQVLLKSLHLQLARPAAAIIPMLFCRRAHPTIFWMAQQLGFVVVELDTQYAGDVPENLLDEVRNELHFTDLRVGSGPSLRVRDRLRSTNLITQTPQIAQKWKNTALDPATKPILNAAWKNRSDHRQRGKYFDLLRSWSRQRGDKGGW